MVRYENFNHNYGLLNEAAELRRCAMLCVRRPKLKRYLK